MKTQSVIKLFFVPLTALLVLNCSNGGGGAAPTPVDPCYDDAGSLLPSCSTSVSCRDEDGDGYTVGAPSTQTEGLVACSLKTDCDDVNEGIFPGAIEILNDGMDQNCDGVDGVNPDVGAGPGTGGGGPGGGEMDADTDGDGVPDVDDNAPGIPNPGQEDTDLDGIPDVVDEEPLVPVDSDGDGIPDGDDNCPSSSDNADNDGDGTGNGCDDDDDGDGILDNHPDNCRLTPNPQQLDDDGDGVGDACDPDFGGVDTDGDGVADLQDNCPLIPNDQADSDGNGIGDACDVEDCTDGKDNDGDGLIDSLDLEQCGPDAENCTDGVDNDGDGDVDTDDCDCSLDADNDGFPDIRTNCNMDFEIDNCPGMVNTNPSEFNDTDDDGHGSACDNCPLVSNPDQADADGDGKGDACEDPACVNDPDLTCGSTLQDSDGDGVPDSTDNCPNAANANQADLDGDDKGDACDTDKDGDGLSNSIDPNPISVNQWGYINKNVSGDWRNETCVNEDAIFSYTYRAGEFNYRVIVQGVMYLKNATPSLPEKDNCRKKDGQFVSIPLPKGSNTLQYGIYIRTGVNVDLQPGSKTGEKTWKSFDVLRGAKFDFKAGEDAAKEVEKFGTKIHSTSSSQILNQITQQGTVYSVLRANGSARVAKSKVTTHYTTVAYDASTMWVKRGQCAVNDTNGNTWSGNSSVIATDLLSGFDGDSQSLTYVAVLRGFRFDLNDSVGAEDAWTEVLVVDADGNSFSKPVGEQVKIKCRARLRGVDLHPGYSGSIYYDLIAFDPDQWGHKSFSWYSAVQQGITATKHGSSTEKHWRINQALQTVPGISKDRTFMAFRRWGFDHNYTDLVGIQTREFDNFSGWLSMASGESAIEGDMVNIIMGGGVYGHEGTEASATAFQAEPDEIKAHLFYCKSDQSCKTVMKSTEIQESDNPASEGSTGKWYDLLRTISDTVDLP